jgi:ribosome-binding protein aMBF1 (putative translation factor)
LIDAVGPLALRGRPEKERRMPTKSSITLERHKVRVALRTARQRAGLTQREVAEVMDWSQSKMLRIESGDVGISTTDLLALLNCYQVLDERRTELVDLVRRNKL